jgi:tRNA (guanine-N7-)-methyltransferase
MAGIFRNKGKASIPSRVIKIVDPVIPLPINEIYPRKMPLEVEIGAGNGRFMVSRAVTHPDVNYLAIERMLGRVRKLDRSATRSGLDNIRVLRLEAFYALYYLLPHHGVQTVYVFFPDPWPKRRHNSRRLFSPLFLDALWHCLEVGGCVQVATDHLAYFAQIREHLAADKRFKEIPAMERTDDEQTDFEILFRGQGLPIGQCAFQSLPVAEEKPLAPLTLPPEMLPREMDDETAEDEPTGRMAMLLKKNKERHGAAHLQV